MSINQGACMTVIYEFAIEHVLDDGGEPDVVECEYSSVKDVRTAYKTYRHMLDSCPADQRVEVGVCRRVLDSNGAEVSRDYAYPEPARVENDLPEQFDGGGALPLWLHHKWRQLRAQVVAAS